MMMMMMPMPMPSVALILILSYLSSQPSLCMPSLASGRRTEAMLVAAQVFLLYGTIYAERRVRERTSVLLLVG